MSPGVCQLQELEKGDKCSRDESLTFKYKDDDIKKKENIEIKEQTDEDKSDKTKEEGGGEESVGRRHWSQFNYRYTTVSWLITSDFDLHVKQVFRKDKKRFDV